MIDPIDSLAFSIQANPGVYALLLGSGVSRTAQIPTGWEITIDLTRKLAVAAGESADPDPEKWYRAKYEEAPDYSKLLDGLARTQADRQQLLRPYLESSQQESDENAKQPTTAHRAIAELVAQGFIRVIITTNFDRLMERALDDAGVSPTVVSSPDHVKGMLPLVHTQHCIIKVHGDYRDTRIRNTPHELSAYPEEYDRILDQIFDEFGLVVCGWSAGWDIALRKAIVRAPSRRFTTFWAVHGEVSDEARQMITHRQAEVIDIQGADSFFETVQQKVESIEQYSRPHPLSTEAAVASLKRYLSEPRYQIQRTDLISETVERVVESISARDFGMYNPNPDSRTVTARVRAYEAACSTLLAMAPIGGFWTDEDHLGDWQRAFERLIQVSPAPGIVIWLNLRRYPALLLLYALGLGAVEADRYLTISALFNRVVKDDSNVGQDSTALSRLVEDIGIFYQRELLEGVESNLTPINDWLYGVLRRPLRQVIRDDSRYAYTFDKLEMLISMGYHYKNRSWSDWFPLGGFVLRSSNRQSIIAELKESIERFGSESPFVSTGIFGVTSEECVELIRYFEEYIGKMRRFR